MPGLAFELSNSPKWLQDYTQELLNKSRALSAERYQQYGQTSPEQTQAIKSQIQRLVESQQQRSKFDIIPFSVTGSSSPIFISPPDLRNIIENPDFANKVFESTTGHHGSKEEIEDLKQRAVKEYQLNQPLIQKIEEEIRQSGQQAQQPSEQGRLAEENLRKLEQTRFPLEEQRKTLDQRQAELQKRIIGLKSEAEKIVQDFNPDALRSMSYPQQQQVSKGFKAAYTEKLKEVPEIQKQIDAISGERDNLDSQIGRISSEIDSQRKVSSNVPQDLFRRASIEREINNLQRQRGLIAPMNEMHQRAISMLERSFDDDTMKLATDELRSAGRQSELGAVTPLVMHSLEGPSDEYMNKYVNDYTKDIRKALEDESEEQYLQEIAPKINMSYAQMGAFHSGARNKALSDSLSKHRVKLHREIAHLTGAARDKAMEHHEMQKRREQSAADILGHTTKSEKEGARHQAELLRNQAVTKHGMSQLNVAALGQVARAKQEQEQHEIDVARHEHQRQLLYPQEQLTREAALLSGLPPPPSQAFTGTLSAGPTPPNLYTIGAGALGSLASNFQGAPQNQRMYKKGGSVRKNYATGGSVGSDDIGKEIRNIIQEQRNADKSHLEHVSHHNPFQSWLMHVGNEMLTNPSEDPLLSVGRGTASSIEHGNVVKERAANLYDKIQHTRLNQYQVLAAYENMKSNQNMREKQFGLQRDQLGLQRENMGLRQKSLMQSMNQKIQPKPLSASERKSEIDAKKDLLRAIRMKKEVGKLGDLVKKTSSGPIIGGIKSYLPKTKIDNQIEVGTNKLILDMHQGMKNIPRSEEFMKRIETTKPNRSNYPEANEEALNLMTEGANDVEENSISTLLSMGWTPQKIEKQFKIKIPEHLLGESLGGIPEEGIKETGNMIPMLDPHGDPLEVPEDDIEEALRMGATYG